MAHYIDKNYRTTHETYLVVNKTLLLLILLAMLYLLVIQITKIGIPCNYKIIHGVECKSCGLTRGLSECLKGNFEAANNYNPQSILWMYFLIIQLLFRPFVLVYYWIQPLSFNFHLKKIIMLDIFILLTFSLRLLINYG